MKKSNPRQVKHTLNSLKQGEGPLRAPGEELLCDGLPESFSNIWKKKASLFFEVYKWEENWF